METEVMQQVLTFATVIGFVTAAFVEMIKRTFENFLNNKYLPVTAFAVGLAVGSLAYPFTDMDLTLRLWAGGISGWTASGLYDSAKTFLKK